MSLNCTLLLELNKYTLSVQDNFVKGGIPESGDQNLVTRIWVPEYQIKLVQGITTLSLFSATLGNPKIPANYIINDTRICIALLER